MHRQDEYIRRSAALKKVIDYSDLDSVRVSRQGDGMDLQSKNYDAAPRT